jgi:hypothetical protein
MATTSLTTPTSAATGNIPFVGTTANDTTGTTIRESFIRINARLGEIYGSQNSSNVVQTPYEDADNIKASAINESHLSATNSAVDNYVLTYDAASGGFTWEQKFDGDITSIVAGNGLTGSSLDINDATLNVIGGDGITSTTDEIEVTVDNSTVELSASDGTGSVRVKDLGITTAKIANDGVTHDKLEARFTASKTDYGNISTDTTIDWSVAAIHQISMTGAATLNFNNYKKGQAVDLLITGNQTITFGTVSGTPSINQVGSSTYDGTKDNIIQVLCTDDDATPTFLFAVGDYTTDTNPA